MLTKLVASVIVLGLGAFTTGTLVQEGGTAAPGYGWAEACKTCHEPIYEAWSHTKHASALNRLSVADQAKECIGCHVTGPKARVMSDTKVLNAGVQCEACHGAAAVHAADPRVKTGLVRKPAAAACEECHSSKSPHFKGLFYDSMAALSHKVR